MGDVLHSILHLFRSCIWLHRASGPSLGGRHAGDTDREKNRSSEIFNLGNPICQIQ